MRNSASESVLSIVWKLVLVAVNKMELPGVELLVDQGTVLGTGSTLEVELCLSSARFCFCALRGLTAVGPHI